MIGRLLLVFLFSALAAKASVEAQLSPNPCLMGETVTFTVSSSEGKPRLDSLPSVPGIEWLNGGQPSIHQSVTIVNGRRSDQHTATYYLRASNTGNVEMPRLQVVTPRGRAVVGPFVLQVGKPAIKSNNRQLSLDEAIRFEVFYDGSPQPPEAIYAGQAVDLSMRLIVDQNVPIYNGSGLNRQHSFFSASNYFPEIDLPNALLRDVSEIGEHHQHILYAPAESTIEDGRRVRVFTWSTTFWALEPGRLAGSIGHTLPITQQAKRTNDPFDMFMGRARIYRYQVEEQVPPIEVLPLPVPALDEGTFIGLIGDWRIDFSVTPRQVELGRDVTIELAVQGEGNIEGLTAPDLDLPGFNVYEPEIERTITRQSVAGIVRWVAVPRTAASELPPVTLATFDPERKTYRSHRFAPQLEVLPGEATAPDRPLIIDNPNGNTTEPAYETPDQAANDILYLKTQPSTRLELPLWKSRLPLLLTLLVLGPLAGLGGWLLGARRAAHAASPAVRRRAGARRRRGKLIARLKATESTEQLSELVRRELVPWLADYYDLPAGSTVDDLRERLDDEELIAMLAAAEHGAYSPVGADTLDGRRLAAKLGRLASVAMAALFLAVSTTSAESTYEQAQLAYDRGAFEEAESLYRETYDADSPDAATLYNLGNCAYAQGKLGLAMAHYARARLLAPRDTDIRENLAFVRRQLALSPETDGTVFAPLMTLRDSLRPDEWLHLAGAAWLVLWTLLTWFAWRRERPKWWLLWPTLVLAGALAAPFSQRAASYRPDQAIVVVDDSPLYRLPGGAGARQETRLDEGTEVRVVEQRSEWSRIRVGNAEGWLPNANLTEVW